MKKEKTFTMEKTTTVRGSEKEELEGKGEENKYTKAENEKKKARRSVTASRNMKRPLESFYEEEEEML